METSDVVVIGGEFAAVAAAYEIQPFANVVLIGQPPLYPAPALLAPLSADPLEARLVAASRAFYQGPAASLARRSVTRETDLLLLASAGELEALDRQGLAPAGERIERREILRELPFLATRPPACGFFQSGILEVDVATVQAAYLAAFGERGGRVVAASDLPMIEGEGAPWWISAGDARLEAGVLVDAAGWMAEEVAIRAGVPPLGLTARHRTLLHFEAALPPPEGMPTVLPLDGSTRLQPQDGLFTAVVTSSEVLDPLRIRPGDEDYGPALDRVERTTRLRVRRTLLRGNEFVLTAPDRAPVVGHDDFVPGFFWIAGEGPAGAAVLPALARAAASLLVGGVLPDELIELGITPEDLLPLRLHGQREP